MIRPLTLFALSAAACFGTAQLHKDWMVIPDAKPSVVIRHRGISANSKFSPALGLLVEQLVPTRGEKPPATFSGEQLQHNFNIDPDLRNPYLSVSITLSSATAPANWTIPGVKVVARNGRFVTARVRASILPQLAREESVIHIDPIIRGSLPAFKVRHARGSSAPATSAPTLNRWGMTGRGVAVGVIDSGIDWRHPDFINADGTSRILAIYDTTDSSYKDSGGKIGSKPPYDDEEGPHGTLYTQIQINAALKGKGVVKTTDTMGHGTAVAGTAAGNGRGAAAFMGVAPEADLIIVRAGTGETLDLECGPYVAWIQQVAKAHHEPVSVNISAGSQAGTHDGGDPQERALDTLIGAGKPGISVAISAGNEGNSRIHVSGHVFPSDPGVRVVGRRLEVESAPEQKDGITAIYGVFDAKDDWGFSVKGNAAPFVDSQGKPITIQVRPAPGNNTGIAFIPPDALSKDDQASLSKLFRIDEQGTNAILFAGLPAGHYTVSVFGATANVKNGRYDLYLPMLGTGTFANGSTNRGLVGTPGTCTNAITVGSYIFRTNWRNDAGTSTQFNYELGDIADYSSPGYRRDGVLKPEISGPGTWTISPLAAGSMMGKELADLENLLSVEGGKYLAWQGTSASTPYVAGTIALMLQKNPTLDEAQIKAILQKTAVHDRFTGGVPNADWGYGKLDPSAAVAATPALIKK